MSTVSFREETIEREWFIVDLDGQTLGRAASRIAAVLRGKHKPTYTPNMDCGDHIIVIVRITPLHNVHHFHARQSVKSKKLEI